MVPFLANEPDWDGNPVTGKDVFIPESSGTTYPDYEPRLSSRATTTGWIPSGRHETSSAIAALR